MTVRTSEDWSQEGDRAGANARQLQQCVYARYYSELSTASERLGKVVNYVLGLASVALVSFFAGDIFGEDCRGSNGKEGGRREGVVGKVRVRQEEFEVVCVVSALRGIHFLP
jgi:hypothetical protein